jgi:hypothetical protein
VKAMPPRTLTQAELTAAKLRRQAKELCLLADELEASVPGRKLTGGMTWQEAAEIIRNGRPTKRRLE